MDKLERALRLVESRQLESARALLEELLNEQPMNTDVLYNLGMLYTELGNPAEAIQTTPGRMPTCSFSVPGMSLILRQAPSPSKGFGS
jgi:cytochrome c-type biogenesis protein CcmH/NrfG